MPVCLVIDSVKVGDYLGRTYLIRIPGFLFTSHPRVLLLSLARSAFIPIFLLCNIVPRSSGSPIPAINSDTVYLLILLVFGLTNG